MAKSIKQLMEGISGNRDAIGQVFGLMGLKDDKDNPVGDGSTLAQLAEAAGHIDIRSGGEPELLHAGNKDVDFENGVYFVDTQRVAIDIQNKYAAGVYPLNEPYTYTADDKTVMTSFTVRKTPSKSLEVNLEHLISSTDNLETDNILTYKPGTVTSELGGGVQVPCWFNEVKIPQVMLGDYEAIYDDVFNPDRKTDIEITATTLNEAKDESDFYRSGIRTVVIPKPNPESRNKTVDVYNEELTFDKNSGEVNDFVEPVASGMISASEFKVEITELYNALASI